MKVFDTTIWALVHMPPLQLFGVFFLCSGCSPVSTPGTCFDVCHIQGIALASGAQLRGVLCGQEASTITNNWATHGCHLVTSAISCSVLANITKAYVLPSAACAMLQQHCTRATLEASTDLMLQAAGQQAGWGFPGVGFAWQFSGGWYLAAPGSVMLG